MLRIAFATLLLTAPVQAAQPYSESLMDCVALIETQQMLVGHRFPQEARDHMTEQATLMEAEALRQAKREGQPDPLAHVATLRVAKAETWSSKSLTYLAFGEGRDWATYCRSFATHLGIALPPLPREDIRR